MSSNSEEIKVGMMVETIGGMRPGRKGKVVAISKHQCTVEEENGRFNVFKRNVHVVSSKIEELGEKEKRKEKMKRMLGRMKELRDEIKDLEEAMVELMLDVK
jgi:transcription elongation factor